MKPWVEIYYCMAGFTGKSYGSGSVRMPEDEVCQWLRERLDEQRNQSRPILITEIKEVNSLRQRLLKSDVKAE